MKSRIIFLFGLLSCFGSSLYAIPKHVVEAKRALADEAVLLVYKYHVDIFGYGGSFLDKINGYKYTVEAPKGLLGSNPSGARFLYSYILQDWIRRANVDTQAIPYYKNFPMTVENFEFCMITENFDERSSESSPKLALIFNLGCKIVYCYRSDINGRLTPYFRETYEEALKDLYDPDFYLDPPFIISLN